MRRALPSQKVSHRVDRPRRAKLASRIVDSAKSSCRRSFRRRHFGPNPKMLDKLGKKALAVGPKSSDMLGRVPEKWVPDFWARRAYLKTNASFPTVSEARRQHRPCGGGAIQPMSSYAKSANASAPSTFFSADLAKADPEIAAAIKNELGRQQHEIELIASENIVSRAVLEAQGSVMTNKYAEGYPVNRYYGGCEFVDV